MPNIKSISQARAELPGSTVQYGHLAGTPVHTANIADHQVGSAKVIQGSVLLYKGTMISTKVIQSGTMNLFCTRRWRLFSPTFAPLGTPRVIGQITGSYAGTPPFVKILTTVGGSFSARRLAAGTCTFTWWAFLRY